MSAHRTRIRALTAFALLFGLAAGSAGSGQAQEYSKIEAGGALKVPSFTLPPSSLISPEMQQAYVEQLRDMQTWPRPPAMDAPIADWQKFRKAFDEALQIPLVEKLKVRYPVDIKAETIAGVHTDVVTPKEGVAAKNKDRVLIDLHGGAFYLGAGAGGLLESIPVAGIGKIKVVSVDYRMAPEHKFPAASEDVAAVYKELLKTYKPENIGIYGCSAGGALAAQSMAWFQKHNLPRPAAVGIFCSSAGGGRGDSTIWDTSGLLIAPAAVVPGAPPAPVPAGYMSSADPKDPLARPLVSPEVLSKFPPTLLVTGTRAGEMSSAIVTHAALLKAGVESQLYLIEGGWHGFFMGNQQIPEARDAVAYIVKWFDAHLGKKSAS